MADTSEDTMQRVLSVRPGISKVRKAIQVRGCHPPSLPSSLCLHEGRRSSAASGHRGMWSAWPCWPCHPQRSPGEAA